ncbi:MAG: hypothetical protein A3J66_03910 [Candidatus Magasanikbacteria bacterium RIFCSPHIGHO2_02_FULL_47_14]|uniref:Uncharacterized protein n=1 Tax=Candidatus Magasanikbacteria bacterium RIFCSPHIGHO2_02_FULL_47_14 TaxID=1798680 RepID=A0A1F6M7I7_9BACT|nr:MAG: hypothetical protein A3J66_03910 [Candidatus Magasanikbacteria bacterium RIFCSPHIGHO2_02_FULL_47_14]
MRLVVRACPATARLVADEAAFNALGRPTATQLMERARALPEPPRLAGTPKGLPRPVLHPGLTRFEEAMASLVRRCPNTGTPLEFDEERFRALGMPAATDLAARMEVAHHA